MALVRRSAVDGRGTSSTTPTAGGGLTVPRQPSAADINEATVGPPPLEEAAAAPDRPPRWWILLIALVLLAAGGAACWLIDAAYRVPEAPVDNVAAVVVTLVLAALVVERLVEPLTRWLPGRRARFRYEQQIADLANRAPQASLAAVAAAKAGMVQRRAERALLAWALASVLAAAGAAAVGFPLLRSLLTAPASVSSVPLWVDTFATGVVVGTLTRPVHDLLARLTDGWRRDPTD